MQMAIAMRVYGEEVNLMALVDTSGLMGMNTMGSGEMEKSTARVHLNGLQGTVMMENGEKVLKKGSVCLHGQIFLPMKDFGWVG